MTRSASILLVDDEVSIQRAVGPLLQSRGYEVEIAGTARRTQGRVGASSGPDRARSRIAGHRGTSLPRIRSDSPAPIIVLSARGGEADKVSALVSVPTTRPSRSIRKSSWHGFARHSAVSCRMKAARQVGFSAVIWRSTTTGAAWCGRATIRLTLKNSICSRCSRAIRSRADAPTQS